MCIINLSYIWFEGKGERVGVIPSLEPVTITSIHDPMNVSRKPQGRMVPQIDFGWPIIGID